MLLRVTLFFGSTALHQSFIVEFLSYRQMLSQLNATLEEENKALVEQVNKLVEQVDIT